MLPEIHVLAVDGSKFLRLFIVLVNADRNSDLNFDTL